MIDFGLWTLDFGLATLNAASRYHAVRKATERLCEPLATEDYVVQSMPDASPAKWHLAHTTWFFETFLLLPHLPDYRPFDPEFGFLFNSYYEAVGAALAAARRGLLTRPTRGRGVSLSRAMSMSRSPRWLRPIWDSAEIAAIVLLGTQHEQQHQELILTDLKHACPPIPLQPVYRPATRRRAARQPPLGLDLPSPKAWHGSVTIGRGFAFDNEGPRHRRFLRRFRAVDRLVTNGEYLAFMADGGYERPDFWLSDGWAACRAAGLDRAPVLDAARWGVVAG